MMTVSGYWMMLIADERWIMKMIVDDWMIMIYDDEYSEWWLDTL
jgi:hypothetical protein